LFTAYRKSTKDKISTAKNIANPGCFATAIQLGLLPMAKAGLLHEVYTTGITGSTGAGQSLSATSTFQLEGEQYSGLQNINAPACCRDSSVIA